MTTATKSYTGSAKARAIIRGAYDLHVHSKPDLYDRHWSDIEAAREYKKAGMAGILIRGHISSTVERGKIAQEVTGFPVWGCILLEGFVGGVNVLGTEAALAQGGKLVCLPNAHAANFRKRLGKKALHKSGALETPEPSIPVVDKSGKLLPDVRDVIRLVAKYGAMLDAGYCSLKETFTIVDEAEKAGVKAIIVSNPLAFWSEFPLSDVKKLASRPHVYVEHSSIHMINVTPTSVSAKSMADYIRGVGAR
ncbi:MAG: hypothetical protein HYX97_00580, partial [Chloroflexi bacterium]|nr:hypothetical protein [Chloroflexota bacterium]